MTTLSKIRMPRPSSMYGVTERKKSELDQLALEILDAEKQVEQFQAIVDSLSSKENNFQALLAMAETNRTNSLNNKNLVDQVVQNYFDLQNSSGIAFTAMEQAESQTQKLAVTIRDVMNKLIYSAEVINKLAALVVRKKAKNPLVSDELVSMMNAAGSDANNAVALMLVALQSTFTAQASTVQAAGASVLEYYEAMKMYQFLSGTDPNGQPVKNADGTYADFYTNSLQQLLHVAYTNAKTYYDHIYKASEITTNQLANAKMSLNRAQGQLATLQAGLAAGNAAALAS